MRCCWAVVGDDSSSGFGGMKPASSDLMEPDEGVSGEVKDVDLASTELMATVAVAVDDC